MKVRKEIVEMVVVIVTIEIIVNEIVGKVRNNTIVEN